MVPENILAISAQTVPLAIVAISQGKRNRKTLNGDAVLIWDI